MWETRLFWILVGGLVLFMFRRAGSGASPAALRRNGGELGTFPLRAPTLPRQRPTRVFSSVPDCGKE